MNAICGAKVLVWKQLRRSPQQQGAIREGYWKDTSLGDQSRSSCLGLLAQEIVFLDELLWDIRELDANIFGIRHRSGKIEVLEINCAELSSFPEEDTVE